MHLFLSAMLSPVLAVKAMKNAGTENTAILTIVSNNYLHFARTMLQSAKEHHPGARLYCVIVDTDLSHAKALTAEFATISIADLDLPLGDEFLFQYSILELNTAVKPWAIKYLLERGHDVVVYVDPDIYFYRPMTDAVSVLSTGVDILLTPHLLAPIVDTKTPSELDIRRAGSYNLGFCAVKESPNTRRFLQWWQQRLTRNCIVDLKNGIFVDQGWVDLVPGLFEKVGILRHPGYNVAYWNLAQRPIIKDVGGPYLIGDTPLVFFHFSGLDPFNPDIFSKYQNRYILSTLGPAAELVESYVNKILQNGATHYARLEYGFGHFSSGGNVPDEIRAIYRSSEKFRDQMGPKPFGNPAAMNDPFLEFVIGDQSPTNAMVASWIERQDLQMAFPLKSSESVREFYHWFANNPLLKGHFPDTVIAHHKEVVEKLKRTSAGKPDDQIGERSARGAQRVLHLYAFILNRNADPAAFRSYGEMCNTNLGYVRAWGHIGFSAESKRKPHLLLRIARALIFSG
jgi:hypothetical protein